MNQPATGGILNPQTTWRLGSVKSISRHPCEGQQVQGWEGQGGWNVDSSHFVCGCMKVVFEQKMDEK